MINITEDAVKNMLNYFSGKEVKPIRVFMNEGGLALALDELKENDYSLEESGLTLVADNEFLKETGAILIDYTGIGFNLKSENQLVKATGKCGGCGGSDSCGDEEK